MRDKGCSPLLGMEQSGGMLLASLCPESVRAEPGACLSLDPSRVLSNPLTCGGCRSLFLLLSPIPVRILIFRTFTTGSFGFAKLKDFQLQTVRLVNPNHRSLFSSK